jgi:hypothetical protein
MSSNNPSANAPNLDANVGDGVSGDLEPATDNRQPPLGTTDPKRSAADPEVIIKERETPVGDHDSWSKQEMMVMRQEQRDWMNMMSRQMKDFMTSQSKVNSPDSRRTRSNMVSDGPFGPQEYYSDLPSSKTRENTPTTFPNADDSSDEDCDTDIDPATLASLKDWLKSAKKVTVNGSSRGVFSGSYWEVWRKEMTLTLKEADLYKFCRTSFTVPTDPKSLLKLQYDKGAHLASRFIMKCVSLELAQEMAYMGTAQEMWRHLVTTQESKTVNERNAMLTAWESLKQDSHEKMAAYIRRLDLLSCQLNEKGRHKDNVDKLHKLLGGLSEGWAAERTSLEVCANFTPYNEMCAILQGIAVRRGEMTGEVIIGGEAHVTGQDKRRPMARNGYGMGRKCLGCGQAGHITDSCPKVTLRKDAAGMYVKVCWHCSQEGHTARNCPEKDPGENAVSQA